MITSVFNYILGKNGAPVSEAPVSEATTTANGAPSLASSGNALVNLFYKAVRGIDDERLFEYADAAAKESLIHTLKIIAYVRDIREGKGSATLVAHYTDGCKKMRPEKNI